MPCKNCKYFKKIRNYSFGECSNDELFQYAEDKEELKDIGNNTLVILGEGEPIVGVEYECSHYVPRGSEKKILTATNDMSDHEKSYTPPAQKKRRRGKSLGDSYRYPDLPRFIEMDKAEEPEKDAIRKIKRR